MSDQPTVRYFSKRNPARPLTVGDQQIHFVICDFVGGAYRGVFKDEQGLIPDEAIYDAEKNKSGKAVQISEEEYVSILQKKRISNTTPETPSAFKEPNVKDALTAAEEPAGEQEDDATPEQIDEVAPVESPKEQSFVTNKKLLAEALDITVERVDELLKREDCPGRQSKGYVLSAWRPYVAESK